MLLEECGIVDFKWTGTSVIIVVVVILGVQKMKVRFPAF